MYDFDADGTARFSPGAIVPTKYRLDGSQLILDSADKNAFTLSWSGPDRVRFAINGTAAEDYTRLGTQPDPQNPLLGEWTGSRDMDGNKVLVHWIFVADGKALLMIRFTTHTGSYTVRNGRLIATFGGRPGLDGSIAFSDGVLAINRAGGRVTRLARY